VNWEVKLVDVYDPDLRRFTDLQQKLEAKVQELCRDGWEPFSYDPTSVTMWLRRPADG
jgi:hypothetical protein